MPFRKLPSTSASAFFCVRRSSVSSALLSDIPERSKLESCCVNINMSRGLTRPLKLFAPFLPAASFSAESTANGKNPSLPSSASAARRSPAASDPLTTSPARVFALY
jgi:hypothetical protein